MTSKTDMEAQLHALRQRHAGVASQIQAADGVIKPELQAQSELRQAALQQVPASLRAGVVAQGCSTASLKKALTRDQAKTKKDLKAFSRKVKH